MKSSPLASSPTNASELEQEQERPALTRPRARDRDHDRETVVSSASSNDGNSGSIGKKRPVSSLTDDSSSDGRGSKRQRVNPEVLNLANRFKQYYTKYETLHRELVAQEYPPSDKIEALLDMRTRLANMKNKIHELCDEDSEGRESW